MRFQILSLSGGGYRGLFTVEVLARLERQAGRPIGECFDLIAGTSIGGVTAIGLAMGKTAQEIKSVFLEQGEAIFPRGERPRGWVATKREVYRSYHCGPKYDGLALRSAIEQVVGAETLIGEARTRLLIPAVNMTKGSIQMFKTPHDPRLYTDQFLKAADVAMATAAAPLFFPMVRIENNFFADGGLAANSPDACAVHEAVQFAGQPRDDVFVLSIGTTSAGFGLPTSLGGRFGGAEWLQNERLVSTVFGAQQQLVDFMLGHELGARYLRIDAVSSAEHAADLGLDLATKARRDTLLGLAQAAYQQYAMHPMVRDAIAHRPIEPEFVTRRREGPPE
jgi:patatin-like phospholipase/acyl hydrolase